MDVKIIQYLLLWVCQQVIQWQQFHYVLAPCFTTSSDIIILPTCNGFWIVAALFLRSDAQSIHPGCKACTHVLMNMHADWIPHTFPSFSVSYTSTHTHKGRQPWEEGMWGMLQTPGWCSDSSQTSCRHRRGLWPDLPVPDPLAPTPAQASRAAARDP